MVKRALFGCLLVIALSACAAGPAIFGPSTGTVTGHVTLRACGGAYRPGQAGCAVRPLAGAGVSFEIVPANGKGSERTAVTDANGAYSITVAPGIYAVTTTLKPQELPAIAGAATVPGLASPRQVTVVAGKTVTADFTYTIQLL